MALTGIENVKSRWLLDEAFPVADEVLAVLIEDAEDVISQALPGIGEWVASGAVPLARYQRVTARMIIRQLKNREGVRQRQETTGSFSGSITMAGDHPGELYLTDADRAELTPEGLRSARGRAFTIMPVGVQRYA